MSLEGSVWQGFGGVGGGGGSVGLVLWLKIVLWGLDFSGLEYAGETMRKRKKEG